ncbi:MAG: hypothetical protein KY395_08610, partial [Actinobacteria bacterium]|nr:hypothetical protein [Actinomycetota bacterium]
ANAPGPDSDLHFLERGQNALTRARIAAQIGDTEEAMRHLREAYGVGLPHHSSQRELPEFEGMWAFPPFVELMRPEG